MADFIFQGVSRKAHADLIDDMLAEPELARFVLSVAFATSGGVALIESGLVKVKSSTTAFVGIRNDVTSAQALKLLLPLVDRLYYVDTGSRRRIFHPKIYLGRSAKSATVLIGSANLTTGGLWNNVEASLRLRAAHTDKRLAAAVREIERALDALPHDYPEHVKLIRAEKEIDELLSAGRVVDESIAATPTPRARAEKPETDTVPRMPLPLHLRFPKTKPAAVNPAGPAMKGAPPKSPAKRNNELVWESNPLTERDLNVPTGPNTARTGSMLFNKGQLSDIDQRHYFRDEVFSDLKWAPDVSPTKKHLERAEADFRLIVRNVDYGKFSLRLTHNSDASSKAYLQSNAMTQVHWEPVAKLIRQRGLLKRTLYLYRSRSQPRNFTIEID